jgi:hypothetical protein
MHLTLAKQQKHCCKAWTSECRVFSYSLSSAIGWVRGLTCIQEQLEALNIQISARYSSFLVSSKPVTPPEMNARLPSAATPAHDTTGEDAHLTALPTH